MKLITTRQLAETLKIETKQVFTYHSRGKINFIKENKKTFIDLDDPVNEKFIMEFSSKHGNVINFEDIKPEEIEKAIKKAPKVEKVNDKETKGGRTREKIIKPVSEYDLHRTDKMKQDAEIAKLRLMQLTGRVLPLDQAQNIFSIHFANISTEFYNTIDNYTVIVVDKLNGSRSDLSEFRSKLIEMVNKAIENAKELTRKELKSRADEYSKTQRGAGAD